MNMFMLAHFYMAWAWNQYTFDKFILKMEVEIEEYL
jgi:hypothetical protein